MLRLAAAALAFLAACGSAPPPRARTEPMNGWGIVIGLPGTGDHVSTLWRDARRVSGTGFLVPAILRVLPPDAAVALLSMRRVAVVGIELEAGSDFATVRAENSDEPLESATLLPTLLWDAERRTSLLVGGPLVDGVRVRVIR